MLPVNLSPAQTLHGFTITALDQVLDGRAVAIQAVHKQSGAQLLHLYADDAENLFAIAFATPPTDDTGLPHILEHTVLCGSKKYPVKDPFVELLKTSLATFLNAMTYPDRTVYPCASMNERDFFNLASVYCDAVFHPLLLENHFRQEGHHLAFATPEMSAELRIKGIVYNEMKGAYSDLDGILSRDETRYLFPDNAYGYDSGGDPAAIPQLTYQQFKDFHARYYHPSNAKIFIYGKIPTAQHLAFLDREYLSAYQKTAIETTIATPKIWSTPRRETVNYPATPAETPATASAVTLTWFTGTVEDPQRNLALNVLDDYLLDNAASPLRKALIDAQLGEELTASGYADHQRDAYFSVGLKGANVADAAKIETLILEVCRRESEQGLAKEKIANVFMQFEMSALEIKAAYPLRLMDLVYRSWMYGGAPTEHLNLRAQLAKLRTAAANNPRFFEEILRTALVDNPHRLTLIAVPDAEYNARSAAAFAEKMRAQKAQLTPDELAKIRAVATAVETTQNTPNSAAAVATLPRLSLRDVSPTPLEFPQYGAEINAQKFIVSDLFTNGINYLNLAVDGRDFDREMLLYLPVYAQALTRLGAGGLDYAALAEKEAACCSGIGTGVEISAQVTDALASTPRLQISLRALNHKIADALAVLQQRFYELDFSDETRLRDILQQSWQHQRTAVVASGHTYAMMHAAKNLSVGGFWHEQMQGVTQARLAATLAENFSAAKIIPLLTRIKNALIRGARFTASVAGERVDLMQNWFKEITAANGNAAIVNGDWTNVNLIPANAATAIVVPSEVAFVAEAFNTVNTTHPAAAALLLLSVNLSYGYLWNEVRVRQGAYGCSAVFSPLAGQFAFRSFRDPLINETLHTYRCVGDYILQKMDLSPRAIEAAIIGAVKTLDQPLRPGYVVGAALARALSGSTAEERQTFRTRLLAVDRAAIERAVREHLVPYLSTAPICVIANREKLTAAQAHGLKLNIEPLV